jgi:carboxylesterase type B
LQGKFHQAVEVMVGSNDDEGLIFISPTDQTAAGILESIQEDFPYSNPSVIDYLLNVLYPPVFDGSYGYTDSVSRGALITGDYAIQCNTDYLNHAFGNRTYAYRFDVPPALHGQDLAYTFYNATPGSVANVTLACAMQDISRVLRHRGCLRCRSVRYFLCMEIRRL